MFCKFRAAGSWEIVGTVATEIWREPSELSESCGRRKSFGLFQRQGDDLSNRIISPFSLVVSRDASVKVIAYFSVAQ